MPILGTVGFLLLLTHRSEFPAVFNRYSIQYTLLLILYALNLGLLWWKSILRVSYHRLIERLSPGPLVSLLLSVISVLFLLDFVIGIGPPQKASDWINLALLGVLLLQGVALREHPLLMSSHMALLASSLVLTLILLESIFVLFLLETQIPKSHPEFLRLMTSNDLRKDNSAWPQPIAVTKPAATFRILGLSDSFGVAGGTRSNYHYLLEDILRRDVSPTIQMVNVSVGAYQPHHQLAILRYAMPYSPDLVLHGFFVGNDFTVYGQGMYEIYTYHGIPIYKLSGIFRYRPRDLLIREWLSNALKFLQEERQRRREQISGEVGTYSKITFLRIQFDRMNDWAKRSEENVSRMKKIFPVLDAIGSVAEKGGARYMMVIHPDQTQIDGDLRREIIATFRVDEDDYDFDLPQKLLHSYCTDRGITCLDLLPSFREKSMHGKLYLPRDTHYNQTGNELAAAKISQFLRDSQLLPKVRETLGVQAQARE